MDTKDNKDKNSSENPNPDVPTDLASTSTPPPGVQEKFNFGDWLKSFRTAKKVSLEEIAAVTKVHISQLKSLEENETHKLPAPAFVRGFLVSYSRHLGINENEVLERYKKSFGSMNPLADTLMPQQQKAALSPSAPKVRLVTAPHIKQAPGSKETETHGPTLVNFKILGLVLAGLCLLGLLIFLLWVGRSAQKTPPSPAAALPPDTSTQSPPAEVSLPGVKPESTATAPLSNTTNTPAPPAAAVSIPKKYQTEIRAIESNWVSLRIDDEPSKGFSIKAGAVQSFEAQRKVTFYLSDAGSLEIKWNGVWYSAPGSRGDVKTLVLPDQLETLTVKPVVRVVPKPANPTPPTTDSATPASSTGLPGDAVATPPEE